MICLNCHAEIADGRKFCPKCGASLPAATPNPPFTKSEQAHCQQCGSPILPNRKFCGSCGGSIPPESRATDSQTAHSDSSAPSSLPATASVLETAQNTRQYQAKGPSETEAAMDGAPLAKSSFARIYALTTAGLAIIILGIVSLHLWGVELNVITSPGGVDVTLDGKPLGRTSDQSCSLMVQHVPRGSHTLTFTRSGSETSSQDIGLGWFELKRQVKATLSNTSSAAPAKASNQSVTPPSSNPNNTSSGQQLVLNVAAIASVPLSESYSGEDWPILQKLFPTLTWKSIDGYRDDLHEQQPWPYAETAQVGNNIQITVMGARTIIFRTQVELSWSEEQHENLYIGKEFTPVLCDSNEPATFFQRYYSVAPPGKKPVYALYEFSVGGSSPAGNETLTFGRDLKLPNPGNDANGGKWTTSCAARTGSTAGNALAPQPTATDMPTPFGYLDEALVNGNEVYVRGWAADSINEQAVGRVVIEIDGKPVGLANMGDVRQDVAEDRGSQYLNSGWHFSMQADKLGSGSHTVVAEATWSSGSSQATAQLVNMKTIYVP